MGATNRQAGFSAIEILVVVGILAIVAAIAVPSIAAAMRVSAYKSTVTAVVSRLSTLRAQASRSSSTRFAVDEIVLEHRSMVINPDGVEPPDGVRPAGEISFQGGTGHCYVEGVQRPAAIVIANGNDPDEAYAIVVGSTSRISTRRKTSTGWEDFVQ